MRPIGKPKLVVDTKDVCFWCLKLRKVQQDEKDLLHSYHGLTRFLNIDRDKVFNSSQIVNTLNVLDKAEILVPMCMECSQLAEFVSELFTELEATRLKLTACIHNIQNVMLTAERNKKKMDALSRRLTSFVLSDIVHANIVKNLRKETIEKCKKKLTEAPKVRVNPKSAEEAASAQSARRSSRKPTPLSRRISISVIKAPTSTTSTSLSGKRKPVSPSIQTKNNSDSGGGAVLPTPNIIKRYRPILPNPVVTQPVGALPAGPTPKQPRKQVLGDRRKSAPRRRVMKCSICGADYYDVLALQKHKASHNTANIENLSFPCTYCNEVFKFYFTHRAHLMKAHPIQMLQKHVPDNTPDSEVKAALDILVAKNTKTMADGTCRCMICCRGYGRSLELESHVLVTHFDGVLSQLRKIIEEKKKEKSQEGNPTAADSDDDIRVITPPPPVSIPEPESPPEFVLDPLTGLIVSNSATES